MDQSKFASLSVKADGAHNIEVLDQEYCDPHYTLGYSDASPATATGLIALFRLVPDDKKLPGFVARWDQRAQSIDVDPEPFDSINRDAWQAEECGYRGHHATRSSEDPRIYAIDIRTPAGHVFKSRCRLNIKIGVQVQDGFSFQDSCQASVGTHREPEQAK